MEPASQVTFCSVYTVVLLMVLYLSAILGKIKLFLLEVSQAAQEVLWYTVAAVICVKNKIMMKYDI